MSLFEPAEGLSATNAQPAPPVRVGLVLPVLLALVLPVVSRRHQTFEEWDGVFQLFAGREIVAGAGYRGWASHFWPPLYPLLTGLVDQVLPGHAAAKLVSGVAAVALLVVVFWLGARLFQDWRVGVLAQALLLVNPLYIRSALQAENHMLDSLFFVTGLALVIEGMRTRRGRHLAAAGVACGLAGLTRYTSLILFLAPLVFVPLWKPPRPGRLALAFIGGVAAISLPWWLYNWRVHGSPLHTWHYLNLGAHVVPGGEARWLWQTQERFTGLVSVVAAYPAAFLGNLGHNVVASVRLSLVQGGLTGLFILPALIESVLDERPHVAKSVLFLLGGYLGYVVFVSQAFVFEEVFLSWIVVAAVLPAALLRRYASLAATRVPAARRFRLPALALGLLLVLGLRETVGSIAQYLRGARDDWGQLADFRPAVAALRAADAHLDGKYIMSLHPGWSYHAGSRYLQLPDYYEGSVDGIVQYRGLGPRVRAYAPRIPSSTPDAALRADYLVYDPVARRALPQFAFLLEPTSPEVPRNFRLVFRSPQTVVYAIDR